jgi:hypothetical protein
MREDWRLDVLLVLEDGFSAICEPIWQGKVDGFVKVDLNGELSCNRSSTFNLHHD